MSESCKPSRNSLRHPANAGLNHPAGASPVLRPRRRASVLKSTARGAPKPLGLGGGRYGWPVETIQPLTRPSRSSRGLRSRQSPSDGRRKGPALPRTMHMVTGSPSARGLASALIAGSSGGRAILTAIRGPRPNSEHVRLRSCGTESVTTQAEHSGVVLAVSARLGPADRYGVGTRERLF